MNRVRVLAVIVSAKRASVQTETGVRFLVTGPCHNTKANFSLLPICNRHRMRHVFWRLGQLLFVIWPYRYNLTLYWVMSFFLVPHMPRQVDRQTLPKKVFVRNVVEELAGGGQEGYILKIC